MRVTNPLVLVLFGVVALALAPSLFLGRVPAETNLIDQFAPWKTEGIDSHHINAGGDSFFAYLPDRLAALNEWEAGRIPLWNPHISGGVPFLGMQTANPFDPLILLHFVLPTGPAMGLGYALLLFAAGFGMMLFLRELGLESKPALLMGGTCFALNPYFIYWMELRVFLAGLALVPVALWALERIHKQRGSRREIGWLALAIGYSAVAGNLQTLTMFLGIVLVRTVWLNLVSSLPRRELDPQPADPRFGARLGFVLLAVVAGLMIGCVPLLASIELLQQSTRLNGVANYYEKSNFLSWRVIGLWFSPDMFGWPAYRFNEVLPVFNRTIASSSGWGSLGIVPLGLALFGLIRRSGQTRERLFWGGSIGLVLAFLISLSSDSIYSFFSKLWPTIGTIDLLRILFVVNLGGAVLAAFGLARFLEPRTKDGAESVDPESGALESVEFESGARDDDKPTGIWSLLLFAILGLTAIVAARSGVKTSYSLGHDLLPLGVVVLTYLAWELTGRAGRGWKGWVLVAVAVIGLLRVQFMFNHFSPANTVYPENATITDLRGLLGPPDYSRFLVKGGKRAMPANVGSVFGLADLGGYSSSPVARYRDLIEWAEDTTLRNKSDFDRLGSPIYRLLGGNYVLYPPETKRGPPKFKEASIRGGSLTVFERKKPLPRAFLVHHVTTVPSKTEMERALTSRGFNPLSTVLLEVGEWGALACESPENSETVEIVSYESDQVVIQVEADSPGVLVLSDLYYPGWRATLDGSPVEIIPAYWGLRGVTVSRGSQEIRFSYRPWWFSGGMALAGMGFLTSVVLVAWPRRKIMGVEN